MQYTSYLDWSFWPTGGNVQHAQITLRFTLSLLTKSQKTFLHLIVHKVLMIFLYIYFTCEVNSRKTDYLNAFLTRILIERSKTIGKRWCNPYF